MVPLPPTQSKELFAVLGLDYRDRHTTEDAKKAFRSEALTIHPDKNPDDRNATAKFQNLSNAYNAIVYEIEKAAEPAVQQEEARSHFNNTIPKDNEGMEIKLPKRLAKMEKEKERKLEDAMAQKAARKRESERLQGRRVLLEQLRVTAKLQRQTTGVEVITYRELQMVVSRASDGQIGFLFHNIKNLNLSVNPLKADVPDIEPVLEVGEKFFWDTVAADIVKDREVDEWDEENGDFEESLEERLIAEKTKAFWDNRKPTYTERSHSSIHVVSKKISQNELSPMDGAALDFTKQYLNESQTMQRTNMNEIARINSRQEVAILHNISKNRNLELEVIEPDINWFLERYNIDIPARKNRKKGNIHRQRGIPKKYATPDPKEILTLRDFQELHASYAKRAKTYNKRKHGNGNY